MIKTACVLFILLVLSLTAFSQADVSDTISWKGAVLNVSTASDIIKKFGPVNKDEISRLPLVSIKNLNIFDLRVDKKEWRVLKFKRIEQASDVSFGFNKENVLMFISFKPPLKDEEKRVHVQSFLKSFEGVEFKPRESRGFSFTVHGKGQSGYILAEVYRIISPFRQNSIYNKKTTIEDVAAEDWDGIVATVQFVSNTLERPANTDILK